MAMWQKPKVKASLMDFVHRTTMCKFYQTGRCNKGSHCTFAHSEDRKGRKGRRIKQYAEGSGKERGSESSCQDQLQSQPDLYKTSLCSKFTRKGFCKNGAQCKYAHGKEELREPGMKASWNGGQAFDEFNRLDVHQDFAKDVQDFVTKELSHEDIEDMSSVGTCAPSPDSSSSMASALDWSPQSSVMSDENVRIKNTFLEFGCEDKVDTPMRRSSSAPDLDAGILGIA